MATRNQLMRLEAQGSSFETDGFFAAQDWRYELLVGYLKLSPSYQAVCKSKGKLIKDAPKDWTTVVKTYNDFRDVFEIRESRWWRDVGMPLFGIQANKTETFIVGSYAENFLEKSTIESSFMHWVSMASPEILVVAIPRNQTKQQALKQVNSIIRNMEFASKKELNIKPKYNLVKSKLQKNTIVFGIEALKLYKRGIELWKIGYKLGLSASACIDLEQNTDASEGKRYLQILASKLIHKAENIAENAARGIFPSDKPLNISATRVARKVGRPKSK